MTQVCPWPTSTVASLSTPSHLVDSVKPFLALGNEWLLMSQSMSNNREAISIRVGDSSEGIKINAISITGAEVVIIVVGQRAWIVVVTVKVALIEKPSLSLSVKDRTTHWASRCHPSSGRPSVDATGLGDKSSVVLTKATSAETESSLNSMSVSGLRNGVVAPAGEGIIGSMAQMSAAPTAMFRMCHRQLGNVVPDGAHQPDCVSQQEISSESSRPQNVR